MKRGRSEIFSASRKSMSIFTCLVMIRSNVPSSGSDLGIAGATASSVGILQTRVTVAIDMSPGDVQE